MSCWVNPQHEQPVDLDELIERGLVEKSMRIGLAWGVSPSTESRVHPPPISPLLE